MGKNRTSSIYVRTKPPAPPPHLSSNVKEDTTTSFQLVVNRCTITVSNRMVYDKITTAYEGIHSGLAATSFNQFVNSKATTALQPMASSTTASNCIVKGDSITVD